MIGNVSGKVGNIVFYTRNGVQVARVYVPHPANPKSAAQNGQRLKLSLAGRLNGILPTAALEGFEGSASERRSKFLSRVLRSSTVSGGSAHVPFDGIVFSEGSLVSRWSHSVSAGTTSSTGRVRRVNFRVSVNEEDYPVEEGYGERFVVLLLNSGTSEFDYAVTGLLNAPTGAGSAGVAETVVSIRVSDQTAEYVALAYVVPFMARAEVGSGDFRVSFLGTDEGTVMVDLMTGESLGRPEVFGTSIFQSKHVIPGPTQA